MQEKLAEQLINDHMMFEIPGMKHYYINRTTLDVFCEGHSHIDSLGRNYISKDKIIKYEDMGVSNSGYKTVKIGRGVKGRKNYYIHRIVAELFIKNENPERNSVNHKDGNKLNNKEENLEWVTTSENMIHSYYSLMTKEERKEKFGSPHKGKKKSKKQIEKIRLSNIKTKSKNKKPNNKCVICNKECSNSRNKTCSKNCLSKLRSEITSGENNPMYNKTPHNKKEKM